MVFLKISQNSQKYTCARVSFLINACSFIKKETLAQVFSCEISEIFKNTNFYRTPLVTPSEGKESFLLARHGVLHIAAFPHEQLTGKPGIGQPYCNHIVSHNFCLFNTQLNSRIGITLSQFDDPVSFEMLLQSFIFSFIEFLSFLI